MSTDSPDASAFSSSPDLPQASPLGRHLGIETVELDDEHAVACLEIADYHKTPVGAVHAGVLMALADNTATILANRVNAVGGALGGPSTPLRTDPSTELRTGPSTELRTGFMVSIDLHAVLLANQTEGELRAEARVVRRGRRVTVIRTAVTGTEGRLLTEVTTTHVPT